MRKVRVQYPPKKKEEGMTETKESTIHSEDQWIQSTLSTPTTDLATVESVAQGEVLLPVDVDLKGFIIIILITTLNKLKTKKKLINKVKLKHNQ